MAKTRHNSNQELIGQGLANIFAPLFGGFAATGAIARTATNIRNGGNSPLAAIVHALVLILVLVLLAPLASNIPLCSLAAILFVVAYGMSDIPHFLRMIRRAPGYDILVLLVTFLLTIFTNLVIAVNVGVILAMLFFIRRMHQSITIEQQTTEALPNTVVVYTIQGPFFFGVAEKIEHALAANRNDPEIIIFQLHNVPFMDITGLETFKELIVHYHHRGIKIYLCGANSKVAAKISKMDMLCWIAEHKVLRDVQEVLQLIAVT